MKNIFRTRLLILCALLLLFLPAACTRQPVFKGAAAVDTRVESTVSSVTSGTVKAEKVAELAFGAVGRVEKLNVRLGDRAQRGQVLTELENKDLRTALETAAAEAQRQEELFKSRSAARHDLDIARTALNLAEINFEKSLIRAPYDGIVVELNLEVGQLSQITAVMPRALIRIVDVEPRYIRAEIDEVDRPRVREGMPARVKILALRREPFKGVVRKIIPWISSAREQERTSEIELNVDAEGLMLPAGASADVEILTDEREGVLSIPSRTLLGRGENRHVFRFAEGRALMTPVKVGLYNYDRAQILEGLSRGDVVLYPSESFELANRVRVKVDMQPWP